MSEWDYEVIVAGAGPVGLTLSGTRLWDPPLAVLPFASVVQYRERIAACTDGSQPREPYQLVAQNDLEPLLKETAEATPT